jgi:hypothetical protein
MGGRTGPEAVEGKEIMEFVPLDENLPQVVVNLIQCLEPEAGARRAAASLVAGASATDQQAPIDTPSPGDSSQPEMQSSRRL